ncbi:MAG: hypothetical protein VB980_07315 [Opitutales bacterium]
MEVEKTHKDLVIKDQRFEKLLMNNPDLLEFGGVRLGKSSKGEALVVAVGYTTIKNSSPTDKIRQLTVSQQKAKAALVGFLEGEYIESMTKFSEELSVTSTAKEDLVEMRSLFNETMLSKIKGRIGSGLERIAFWKSADGLAFYQAVGFVVK